MNELEQYKYIYAEQSVQISIAISLKRIADMMEKKTGDELVGFIERGVAHALAEDRMMR